MDIKIDMDTVMNMDITNAVLISSSMAIIKMKYLLALGMPITKVG